MALDFKVARLSYKDLKSVAQQLRMLGDIHAEKKNFDIVDLLHNVVIPALKKEGKHFDIEVDDAMEHPAEVDLQKQTLFLESWIITAARKGNFRARLILAHEIAHMILHKDQVMAFSADKAVQLGFLEDEDSAEWQAQKFASLLLLPDEIIVSTRKLDPEVASIVTLVEPEVLTERRVDYEIQNRVALDHLVECQCECGNLSVIKFGAGSLCGRCGSIT